jgi:hypothetical protein|tara:strand:+ start:146 stop:403 length:258 start_codon:yes stop_codon:yes gene_type:complete
MDQDKLIAIANDLTNEDICELINMVAPRLDVYFGILNNHCFASEVSFACMNGCVVQINCKSADLDDLAEDEFIRSAIENKQEAAH